MSNPIKEIYYNKNKLEIHFDNGGGLKFNNFPLSREDFFSVLKIMGYNRIDSATKFEFFFRSYYVSKLGGGVSSISIYIIHQDDFIMIETQISPRYNKIINIDKITYQKFLYILTKLNFETKFSSYDWRQK